MSEATVSRVLNGKPGVSEATRQAVLTALDVLGYERPTKLRGSARGWSASCCPSCRTRSSRPSPRWSAGALAQQGFTPVLCTRTAGGVSEADYVELLLQQQVSGVVFAGGHYAQADAPHEHYHRLAERRPAGRAGQRGRSRTSASRASRATTRSRSSRRTGTCARSATSGSGWCSGRPTTCRRGASWRRSRSGPRRARARRRRWSSTRCSRSRAARPRPSRLLERGRHRRSSAPATRWRSARSGRPAGPAWPCPSDISVVGYDDSALMSCTEPPLTTVRQPIEAMGRAAIELLRRPDRRGDRLRRRAALRARARRPRLDRARRRQRSPQGHVAASDVSRLKSCDNLVSSSCRSSDASCRRLPCHRRMATQTARATPARPCRSAACRRRPIPARRATPS